jgi:predicted dehydrogenase
MNSNNRNGVIIVGSGRGSLFARIIIEGGQRVVAAMVDSNTEIHEPLRQRFREEYHSPDTLVMGSLEEALVRFPQAQADSVLIVTPNHTHAEMLRLALTARRHVLLEKPVAADDADLRRIAALVAATDRIVQVGFVLRYSRFFRKIKQLIDDGTIGRVVMMQINEWLDFAHSGTAYRRGWRRHQALTGGFLNEKCSHDLDLLCWFKDGQALPTRVYSAAGTEMFPPKDTPKNCLECDDRPCPFRYHQPPFQLRFQLKNDEKNDSRCVFRSDADIFNHQSVIITYSDGTQGLLTLASYSGEPGRTLNIHGTEGYLRGNLERGELELAVYRRSGAKLEPIPLLLDDDGHGGGDSFILPEFFDCIERGVPPSSSVKDGLRASAIAFAADDSAASGQAVDLVDRLDFC